MRIRIISLLLGVSSLVAGCASIMTSDSQEVTFQSTPEGALVKVDGNELGRTPLTLKIAKKTNQTLTFEKEGYKTYSAPMTTETSGWFFGNILLGGFFGSTTDGVTGAMHEYAPGEYIVTLEPESISKFGADVHLSARETARRFIYLNYEKIQSELSKESGETLESALYLLNVTADNKSMAVAEMRKIMLDQKNPADFVDLVLNKYLG